MKNVFDIYAIIQFLIKYRNYLIIAFLFIRGGEYLIDTIKGDGDGSITSFYPYMLLTATKLILILGFVGLSIIKFVDINLMTVANHIINKVGQYNKVYYFGIVALIYVGFSIYYNQGGFLDNEAEYGASENSTIGFIRHYLSDAPFLNKIFDVRLTDNGAFQSRELSFIFDYIDCQFIDWCIGLGMPHFYSITHHIFTLLIGGLIYYFCVKIFGLPAFVSLLLVIILWTSPCIFYSVTFYRSSKISTSFFMVWYFVLLYQIFQDKYLKISILKYLLCFLIAVAITFTDRQGFFFMLVAVLFFAFKWISMPTKTAALLLLSCLGAVLLNTFYNYYLGGKIIFYLNGYYPDFSYQKIPWFMLTEWWSYQDMLFFISSALLLFQEWRLLLGNIPVFMMFVLIISFIILFAKYLPWKVYSKELESGTNIQGIAGALLFILLIMMIVLNVLMIMRHPALNQEGYFRYYYPIPATVLLFIVSIWAVHLIHANRLLKPLVLYVAIALVALSNIFSLPAHDAILRSESAPRGRRMRETPIFLEGLANLNNPAYQLSDSLANIPIFKFFKERHTQK
jgi:hypothetical protein